MAKKFPGDGVAPEVAVVKSVESVESSLTSTPGEVTIVIPNDVHNVVILK
jgi:hypothetical protein